MVLQTSHLFIVRLPRVMIIRTESYLKDCDTKMCVNCC